MVLSQKSSSKFIEDTDVGELFSINPSHVWYIPSPFFHVEKHDLLRLVATALVMGPSARVGISPFANRGDVAKYGEQGSGWI